MSPKINENRPQNLSEADFGAVEWKTIELSWRISSRLRIFVIGSKNGSKMHVLFRLSEYNTTNQKLPAC